jgi:hypothetical protein
VTPAKRAPQVHLANGTTPGRQVGLAALVCKQPGALSRAVIFIIQKLDTIQF